MGDIHKDHRKRLRERFRKEGLSGFADHNILELLLFYAIPRIDTNPIAHNLLKTFGSLSAVFDAPYAELVKVDGIGESAATLINMMPNIAAAYLESHAQNIKTIESTKQAAEFLMPKFIGKKSEIFISVSLDPRLRVIAVREIEEGSRMDIDISMRKIFEIALQTNAFSMIFAHNHPLGKALPSREDFLTAKEITKALKLIDVEVRDHMIFAENDSFSMGPCDDYYGDLDTYM